VRRTGEDAALYDTVTSVGMEVVPGARHQRAFGKDSLSIAHALGRRRCGFAGDEAVTAPVSLIVSAFASLADVRTTLTPQLQAGDTTPDPDRPRAGQEPHGRIDARASAEPVRRHHPRPR